jgi:hypothetical protein
MTTRIWQRILPTLLLLAVGGPARALVVDDFEGGAFSYVGSTAGDGGSQSVSYPAQVLGGTRQVYVESNSALVASVATLTLSTASDDGASLVLPIAGGLLELAYEPPAPFDLTLGGSATAIEVTLPVASPGAMLSVVLTDTGSGSDSVAVPILTSATSYSFALADFTAVDATLIDTIKLSVTSATAGSFEISHIALGGSGSALLWDVTQAQVSGPPYPTAPVEFEACMPPDPFIPVAVAALSLVEAKMGTPPTDLPFELVAAGNGELGSAGEQVGIEANWMPEPRDEYPDEVSFELELALQPLGGLTPGLQAPPDDSFPSPEAFRVSFTVDYENASGQVVGSARHHMHFQIGPGQDLEFTGVSATEGSVHISFGTEKGGVSPQPFTPIFTMTLSAEFTPALPVPALPPWALGLLGSVLLGFGVAYRRRRA